MAALANPTATTDREPEIALGDGPAGDATNTRCEYRARRWSKSGWKPDWTSLRSSWKTMSASIYESNNDEHRNIWTEAIIPFSGQN